MDSKDWNRELETLHRFVHEAWEWQENAAERVEKLAEAMELAAVQAELDGAVWL